MYEPGQTVILHSCKLHLDWNGKTARIVDGPYIVERIDDGAKFTTYHIEAPDGRHVALNSSLLAPLPDLRRTTWGAIERTTGGWNPARDLL